MPWEKASYVMVTGLRSAVLISTYPVSKKQSVEHGLTGNRSSLSCDNYKTSQTFKPLECSVLSVGLFDRLGRSKERRKRGIACVSGTACYTLLSQRAVCIAAYSTILVAVLLSAVARAFCFLNSSSTVF